MFETLVTRLDDLADFTAGRAQPPDGLTSATTQPLYRRDCDI